MIQDFNYYKPSVGQAWWLVALVFLGSIVVGICLPHAPQSLTYGLMMLFPLAWSWWSGRTARLGGGHPLPVNAPHFERMPGWGVVVLSAIALLALSVVIEPTTTFIPMPESIKSLFEKVFMESALGDMILATCILAPLLEEFLCRGLMLRGILLKKGPVKAILWSAFLFALMHMNPWQSIPAFLIGLFLGWIYWRTHCLWITIFLHCLNNSLSTVISRVWPDLPIDAGLYDILPQSTFWLLFASCAVVLAITIHILYEKTLPTQIQRDSQRESLGQ